MKRPAAKPLTDEEGEVRELALADFRAMRPIAEVDPGMLDAIKEFRRAVGRPKAVAPKVHVGFRLAADVVASIKASGPGYNARVEQALRAAGFGGEEQRKALGKKAHAAKKKRAEGLASAERGMSKRRA
jgi:uncharacterized protein (DUF4415 family)